MTDDPSKAYQRVDIEELLNVSQVRGSRVVEPPRSLDLMRNSSYAEVPGDGIFALCSWVRKSHNWHGKVRVCYLYSGEDVLRPRTGHLSAGS